MKMSHFISRTEMQSKAFALCGFLLSPVLAFADSTHISNGPVTNWSYGWKTAPAGGFTSFHGRSTVFGLPALSDGSYPFAVFNNTNATVTVPGKEFHLPRNQVAIHPSNDGKLAVVRWTADFAGAYQVQGLFDGLETCGYRNVYIVVDSVTVFNQQLGGLSINPFSFRFDLSSGSTVDFEVDDGGNQYYCDSVGVSALITNL